MAHNGIDQWKPFGHPVFNHLHHACDGSVTRRSLKDERKDRRTSSNSANEKRTLTNLDKTRRPHAANVNLDKLTEPTKEAYLSITKRATLSSRVCDQLGSMTDGLTGNVNVVGKEKAANESR